VAAEEIKHLIWTLAFITGLSCHARITVDLSQRQAKRRPYCASIAQPSWRRLVDEEIRKKVLKLLDEHRIMTVATLRPDGWPQATTVGYVNEGLTLYFFCGLDSQKAANIARDDRVSLTIDHDTPQVMEITGLSMAGHAQLVINPAEARKVLHMLPLKYPEQDNLPGPMPTPEQVRIFRVTPTVISVLDYSKGFGHTDLVTC
jgi:PPOX class probable F420-dependent enzyme